VVWADEFDGTTLDTAKWNYDTGTGAQYGLEGWGNSEKQFYKPENIIVKDGFLYIEARKDNDEANSQKGAFPYTSGKLTTGGNMSYDGKVSGQKFAVMPGDRIEARIKSARGVRLWPAFWMIGATSNAYGGHTVRGWPRCGEIDILEIRGGTETRLNATIHYGPFWPENRATGDYIDVEENLADDWHVYGVTWDKNALHFLLDGVAWFSIDLAELHRDNPKSFVNEAFTARTGFVININLAVGGAYIGNRIPDDSVFSANNPYENRCLMVDWVRVYRR
jgi:beta-glucanase (GH16 family)